MWKNPFFVLSYWIANLSPLYALLAIGLGTVGVSGKILVLPFFVVMAPAGAYLASRSCKSCGNLVYTAVNLRAVHDGLKKLPLHRFVECPTCGQKL